MEEKGKKQKGRKRETQKGVKRGWCGAVTMSPGPADILRAVVAAGRESRESTGKMRARLERAWSGLSRAEQLALGGTLVAALAGGGLLLVRSRLNARPLGIAEMRPKTTKELLWLFGISSGRQQDDIARFCVCRVHDVRDELLGELGLPARKLLRRLVELLKRANPTWSFVPNRNDGLHAQIPFIERAVSDVDCELFALMERMKGEEGTWGDAGKNAEKSGATVEPFFRKLQAFVNSDEYKKSVHHLSEELSKATPGSKKHKNAEDSLQNVLRNALQDSDEYKKAEAPLRKEFLKIIWGREKLPKGSNELARQIAKVSERGSHAQYGLIETWDVRDVTDMRYAFAPAPDESELQPKKGPFWEAKAKEPLDLSFWDTRNAQSMLAAFKGYRGDVRVGMWDTRNVTNMAMTFADAGDFNGDIANWDMSSVTHTTVMFDNAKKFDRDLSEWNLDSVVDYKAMFRGSGIECNEDKKPKNVRMANLHDLEGSSTVYEYHCVAFGQPGPADILRAVVAAGRESRESAGKMRARLERAWSGLSRAEQLALGGTLIAAITGGGLLVRSGLNAMARDLSIAEMRPMTTMKLLRSFERGNESQKDAIAKFCFCRVHDLRELLFDTNERFETLAAQILSRVGTILDDPANRPAGSEPSVTAQREFIEAALAMRLEKGVGSTYPKYLAHAQIALGGMSEETISTHGTQEERQRYEALLEKHIKGQILDRKKIQKNGLLTEIITKLAVDGYHKLYGHIATWDVREVTDMSRVFKGQSFMGTLGVLDLSFWDTSNVKNMREMFHGYHGNVEVGMWDTGKVTDMSGMFAEAREFNGDIGNWDTGEVENMARMFENASQFNCAIGNWNTSKAQHTGMMFKDATEFNQDLATWKLDSLKDFDFMFRGAGMENDEHKKPAEVRPTLTLFASQFGQPSLRSYV